MKKQIFLSLFTAFGLVWGATTASAMKSMLDEDLIPSRQAKGSKVIAENHQINFYDIVIPLSQKGIRLPHSAIGTYRGTLFELDNPNKTWIDLFNEMIEKYQHSLNPWKYHLFFDDYKENKYSFILKSKLTSYSDNKTISENTFSDKIFITFFAQDQGKIREEEVCTYIKKPSFLHYNPEFWTPEQTPWERFEREAQEYDGL
jgi:hypothetical protein